MNIFCHQGNQVFVWNKIFFCVSRGPKSVPELWTSRQNSKFCLVWVPVIIMSRTTFRVNPHSIVCLNVKKLLTWSRRHIWSLSDNNEIRIHKHLVGKRTLNHLAKSDRILLFINFYEVTITNSCRTPIKYFSKSFKNRFKKLLAQYLILV